MTANNSLHPNPIFERKNWQSLNGEWDFEIDNEVCGMDLQYYKGYELSQKIIVPFCPESELSGIGNTNFINSVWYKKVLQITKEQLEGRVFIHIGACDFDTTVYVNGKKAGTHIGGYASFSFDITDCAVEGANTVVIYAYDDVRSGKQWRGKQCESYHSKRCDYTRTTGIWQSVWLEYTPKSYVKSIKIYPDLASNSVAIHGDFVGCAPLQITASYDGEIMGQARTIVSAKTAVVTIPLKEQHLWELGCGRLYDLEITFGEDIVNSYFGMRQVCMDGHKFMLNGKSVFQRLILDQGFYPDGIYTAKDDETLKRDIELSMAMGFNGARLHQKVFDPRFLYHCDKAGYMTWGETGSWGFDFSDASVFSQFTTEWMEVLNRDFNHPSIVGWCPMNESWYYWGKSQDNNSMLLLYMMTKNIDPTRPCIDSSGGYHVATDIYDLHDYEQNAEIFKQHYSSLVEGGDNYTFDPVNERTHKFTGMWQTYAGEPRFISEYGGTWWSDENTGKSWGYGNAPQNKEEVLERYSALTTALLEDPMMMGFCYTQLTDVEQEKNGLYTYNREPKFDIELIRKINTQKAAIED